MKAFVTRRMNGYSQTAHLRDGCKIPEQVGGTYGQLVSVQRQVLLGLLGQLGEVLRGLQVEQSDAGF